MMTRAELIERMMFAVDGYRFGEWDIVEAGSRLQRLVRDYYTEHPNEIKPVG